MTIFQPDRFLIRQFVASSAKQLQGDILDVGGGRVRRYAHYFSHARSYRTLDPDPEAHADVVASATAIPLPEASVDGIVCTQVLLDIFDVQKAVDEMARILRPGGHILITDSLTNAICDEPHNYWRFTSYAFQELMKGKFTDIRIERRGGYRCAAAQNWIRYCIERYRLYDRPLLGRAYSLVSTLRSKWAIWADALDTSDANRRFAIGYNILARRA
jgi:SAM-dependent methyltransferase